MLGHVLRRRGILSTSLPRLLRGIQELSGQMETTWKMSGTPWACDDVLSLFNWKRNCSGVPPQEESLREGLYSKLEEDQFRAIKAATLLSSLNVYNFRLQLEELSIKQADLDYEELVELARQSGAATTSTDAHLLCDALVAAGVVLRYGNRVYINPSEVADELRCCLPQTIEETEQLVSELEAELAPLKQKKDELDQKVTRVNKSILKLGFLLLIQQFCLHLWMTYYEYSWEIVSPLAYFETLGTGILAYAYFMFYSKPFELSSIRTRIDKYYSLKSGDSFDALKYEILTKKLARHHRFLNKYLR